MPRDETANPCNDGSNGSLWRRQQTLEVWVFLFLIVPSMALSFFAVRQGQLSFPLTASAVMLRDMALVCLILFFLWRNGEPRLKIGTTLWVVVWGFGIYYLGEGLHDHWAWAKDLRPYTWGATAIVLVAALAYLVGGSPRPDRA